MSQPDMMNEERVRSDELGFLVERCLVDYVAGEEPSPRVWENLRALAVMGEQPQLAAAVPAAGWLLRAGARNWLLGLLMLAIGDVWALDPYRRYKASERALYMALVQMQVKFAIAAPWSA